MCDIESQKVQKSPRKAPFLLFLKTVIHFVYIVINIGVSTFGLVMWVNITEEQMREERIATMKYYIAGYGTNWNYLFQTVFLFLALSHDGLEWASKQDSAIGKKIRYWRDVVFSGLVVPYTCFVFTMFWSLYSIDRELVFPLVYDAVVPWWFNHCVHTNILALLVLETILQPRRYPTDRKRELIFNGSVGILYAIVYYTIFFFAGRWLYNVFGIMTWWQVCLFQLLIWSSSYVFYELQFPINRLIHGKEPEEEKTPIENTQEQNGVQSTAEAKDMYESKETNGHIQNGGNNYSANQNGAEKNGANIPNTIDFKTPPFSTKSWSLKYRTTRNQFENTNL